MAKYVPNDHGNVVDGKIVFFFQTPPAHQAPSAARPSPAERAETARLQAAALTAAAQKGVPFCAECEQARRDLYFGLGCDPERLRPETGRILKVLASALS
jgi:hypothetical protein